MSSTSRGPGRPPRQSLETAQKGREYLELVTKFDVPVGKIAERENVSQTWVWELIKKARAEAAEQASDVPPPDRGEPRQARPLRRLSRRTAVYRAWEMIQQRPISAVDLAANGFWIRLIVAIHEEGDGFRLGLGEPGSRLQTRAELADLFHHGDRPRLDIDGWLKELFLRGRLVDLNGVDIGIPRRLGLAPDENSRGEPLKARALAKHPASAQAPLPFRPMVLPGGLMDLSEIPLPDLSKIRIFVESDLSEIPSFDLSEIRISLELAELARTAAAAAYAIDIQTLAAAAATESRACDLSEIRISVEFYLSEIPPPDSTDINSQRSPPAELVASLATLAKLGRPANADDLGQVEAWIGQGVTPETMRGVIGIKLAQRDGRSPGSLRYFDGAIQDSRKAKLRVATPQAATPQPMATQSAEDQALRELLKPCLDAWIKDRNCPFPPAFDTFKAACLTEKGKALAYRWLELWGVWDKSGRPADLKPPDLALMARNPERFEAAMLEIEEELTRPDPPRPDG